MPNQITVLDVETAKPLEQATISRGLRGTTVVECCGYISKIYAADPPSIVRLLAERPSVYIDRPSAAPGQSINVHYSAPRGCTMRLVSGDGKSAIRLNDGAPNSATVPDEDVVAVGLNWPSVSVQVPRVSSGIWHIEVADEAGSASAPLVIRASSEEPRPRVLAVASVATWQCYNAWGGRNRYRSYERGERQTASPSGRRRLIAKGLYRLIPEVPRARLRRLLHSEPRYQWAFWPLTSQRPWQEYLGLGIDVHGRALNHLAALDRKILAWLEREGFDFECVADLDLHHNPSICAGRDAVLLLGHSEYWSTKMFDQLLSAHRYAGTWVLNLSGNSIYRRITVATDSSVQLADIVFALSGRDETELTGVRYSERAYGTAAAYIVKRPKHWVFEGVGLTTGDSFGHSTLVANTSASTADYDPSRPTNEGSSLLGEGAAGFEVDRRVMRRRNSFTVVAKGAVPKSADLVVKEPRGTAGGAFSASSITFGGALLVDETCSRIVANVLRRSLGGE